MFLIYKQLTVFAAIWLLLAGAVFAQSTATTDTFLIETLRVPLSAGQSGRSITVIEARELQKLPAVSLDEVLRYVAGLEATVRNAGGAQADLSMRGSSFQQVLVLVDGLRAKDPLTGHFSTYLPINPAEIARIEVIRGPASSLYGPDALGGVINIVTHTGLMQTTQSSGNGQVLGGQHNLLHVQAGAVVPRGKHLFSGGFQRLLTDGNPLPSGQKADVATLQGSVSWGMRLGKAWTTAVRLGYDARDFNAQYFYSSSKLDSAREQVETRWAQAQAVRATNTTRTVVQASYRASNDYYRFRPLASMGIHFMQAVQVQAHHSWQTGQKLHWVAGLQADSRSIVSSDRGDHAALHAGAFALGAWRPLAGLALTGGLRGDYDQNYGFELLPQANLSWQATDKITLRAGAGRSIRAADFTERYLLYKTPATATDNRRIGNPDLQAERAWSYELGGNLALHPLATLSLTGFYRDARNQIDYVRISGAEITTGQPNVLPTGSYYFAQNLFAVRTLGAEAEVRGTYQPGKNLSLAYSVGYQYIHYLDSVSALYLTAAARHLVNGSATLRIYGAEVALTGAWKQRPTQTLTESASQIGAVQDASYAVWNARVGYSLKGFLVFVQANNLFDKTYSDFPGVWMPGRWLSAGAGYRW